jgi:hypothetical protein
VGFVCGSMNELGKMAFQNEGTVHDYMQKKRFEL